MSSGIASLHKILKDDTRQKIILLLNEKGSLGYTELLDATEAGSTGLLNYHLKVLGDLLIKDESGQYVLTEKGKLASRLLTEFPEDRQGVRKKWQKRFFAILVVSQIVYLTITSTLYLLGIVDFYRLALAIIYFAMATTVVYFGYRMQRSIPLSGSKEEKNRMRIGYTAGGVWFGLVVFFFGAAFLLRALQEITGQPLLHTIFWTDWYLGFSLVLAPIIGGVIGYYFGKKRDFQKPKWAVWLDNHF
jgi:DNA-binding transcriptional ArsR family regulator